jgi:hypothetical protein
MAAVVTGNVEKAEEWSGCRCSKPGYTEQGSTFVTGVILEAAERSECQVAKTHYHGHYLYCCCRL